MPEIETIKDIDDEEAVAVIVRVVRNLCIWLMSFHLIPPYSISFSDAAEQIPSEHLPGTSRGKLQFIADSPILEITSLFG
jgi:hypothetical protein